MIIECPKCKKENTINFSNGLKCEHCHIDISNNKYKKSAMAASAALIIGASGYHLVDKYIITDTRYPLIVESAIIDQCKNGHQKPMLDTTYIKKSDVCICALSRTMKTLSYSDLKKNKNEFFNVFNANVSDCYK